MIPFEEVYANISKEDLKQTAKVIGGVTKRVLVSGVALLAVYGFLALTRPEWKNKVDQAIDEVTNKLLDSLSKIPVLSKLAEGEENKEAIITKEAGKVISYIVVLVATTVFALTAEFVVNKVQSLREADENIDKKPGGQDQQKALKRAYDAVVNYLKAPLKRLQDAKNPKLILGGAVTFGFVAAFLAIVFYVKFNQDITAKEAAKRVLQAILNSMTDKKAIAAVALVMAAATVFLLYKKYFKGEGEKVKDAVDEETKGNQ